MLTRYVWRTILPYFLLVWVLLTAILFVQQGSRFSEILFGANIPARLLFELSVALIISVVAFTGPMALLAGVVIGLGQLRGDSELIVMQAAGAGLKVVLLPCLLAGALVSVIALAINLEGVPLAASIVRRVAVETALLKLESPIEPGVFNTEFSNYVIYVRDGNNQQGIWERVFIYLPEKENGQTKLITARSGRIDTAFDRSELVLSDAVVTTLPAASSDAKQKAITFDSLNDFRVSLDTGRKQLLQKLEGVERTPDEMGLSELAQYGKQKSGRERIEAAVLWHRRLALSLAPFFLALLGVAVSWRFARGGRGWSSILSLALMIFYYLLSLLGEQAARAGWVSTALGGWLATLTVVCLAVGWLWRNRRATNARRFQFRSQLFERLGLNRRNIMANFGLNGFRLSPNNFEFYLLGLLERDFLQNLWRYFLLVSLSLLTLFEVFTVFEVLRGLTANWQGAALLFKYLFWLSPFVFWQIAPTALMIAVLITYTVKARQQETVVWGAAGQSIYLLILPSVLSALVLGLINWQWQEKILPFSNPRQDILRSQLRGGAGSKASQEGRFWVAGEKGIYSFASSKASDNVTAKDFTFYQFSADETRLEKMVQAKEVNWQNSTINFGSEVHEIIWRANFIETKNTDGEQLHVASLENPFNQLGVKAAHLSTEGLQLAIKNSDSPSETRKLKVILQQRQTTLFLPLIIVFFTAPLALARSSRGGLGVSVATTVGAWLLFTATNGFFERLGSEGVLPPEVAVWAPLIFFSSLGWYLLAKLRN